MKNRSVLVILLITGLVFLWPPNVWAAKRRPPRGSKRATSSRRTYSRTRGVKAQVQFRPDRRGLFIKFWAFNNIAFVTYALTYTADSIPQGIRGTVRPETAGEQRELLFGTCSHGVCRYHTNITNARLVIDSRLKSGLIIRKPYRIKV